jgi:glutathione synthase/RimK-type ligase-like ATP-grasp enzyme
MGHFPAFSIFVTLSRCQPRYICDVLELNNQQLNVIVVQQFLQHASRGICFVVADD